jgi:hypothetical protein
VTPNKCPECHEIHPIVTIEPPLHGDPSDGRVWRIACGDYKTVARNMAALACFHGSTLQRIWCVEKQLAAAKDRIEVLETRVAMAEED